MLKSQWQAKKVITEIAPYKWLGYRGRSIENLGTIVVVFGLAAWNG